MTLVYYGMWEVKEVAETNVDGMLVRIGSENHAAYLKLGCGA